MNHSEIVSRRRALTIPGYRTLADVGFDGEWVTPLQISAKSPTGPVLVALHWLDEPSINENRPVLERLGYLPGIRFNNVLDIALQTRGISRSDIYMTQAFHLIPQTRSQRIPWPDIQTSFREVTRHELEGRKIITLGAEAARLCREFGIAHNAVCHPSRRGRSNEENAAEIACAI